MTPRPKPKHWSAAEILRAIAREIEKPRPGGIGLAVPRLIDNVDRSGETNTVRLGLPSGLTHIRRWADVLERVDAVHLESELVSAVHVHVLGRLPRGPMVELTAWAHDVMLSEPVARDERRPISLEQLRQLDDARRGVR